MNLVSILGLFALLACAWAISFHRRRVKLRPVFWGLGLQLVFALFILRKDAWSFVGLGAFALLVIAYILRPASGDTRRFRPRLTARRVVGAAVVGTLTTGLIVSGTHGEEVFSAFSSKIAEFLNLSDYGARFLFGNLADPAYFDGDGAGWRGFGFQFAFKVLPTIIFFGGFMGVCYYLGIVQKVITAIAGFMRWTFGTSGAETLSCSANIFVGQTEAPLLIRPFIGSMTQSELLCIMVGGFATIAGGVLAGYIAMGIPAGHLVAATVMSAPASLAIAKIVFPETEHSATAGDVDLPAIDSGANVIEAATSGITDGLKLAVNVGAMLIGFIALINVVDLAMGVADRIIDGTLLPYLADTALGFAVPDGAGAHYDYTAGGGMSAVSGEYAGIVPGSLRTLFGVVLKPLAWLLGVPWEDAGQVGNLLGIKLSLNEFVSFGTLGTYVQEGSLSPRAVVISTYALCGFANFASIGIQIGGLSALAPERRGDLARVGLRAMLGGALASWTTACVAGILV